MPKRTPKPKPAPSPDPVTTPADHDAGAALAESLREVLRNYIHLQTERKRNSYNAKLDSVAENARLALQAWEEGKR